MFYAPEEMTERIRLTPVVNRLLWPQLRELGFRFHDPEEGDKWKEGRSLVRTSGKGREQFLLLGRDKFGHQFGINVSRQLANGSVDWLDVGKVGLSRQSLSYQTQAEAEAVLQRIAAAMKSRIIPWLDEDPPSNSLSVGLKNEAAQ